MIPCRRRIWLKTDVIGVASHQTMLLYIEDDDDDDDDDEDDDDDDDDDVPQVQPAQFGTWVQNTIWQKFSLWQIPQD